MGSPAFKAGIAPGMTLVAVNARAYSPALLRDAIKDAQTDKTRKIDLLVRKSDTYTTATLDYHDGLKYPRLERIETATDRLSELMQPLVSQRKARQ